jgi:hypothetical protein
LSQAAIGQYGSTYHYTTSSSNGVSASGEFRPTIPIAGKYDVFVWYGNGTNRSTNVQVSVFDGGVTTTSRLNQAQAPNVWRLVASARNYATGTNAYATISNDSGESNRVVLADAVMWSYNVAQDIPTDGSVPSWWSSYYFGTPNISGAADADGDGVSNFFEYVTGTLPNDSSSKFGFKLTNTAGNLLETTISPYLAGRVYDLQCSTNLGVNWFSAPTTLTVSNGAGILTTTNVSREKAFYRLSISLVP